MNAVPATQVIANQASNNRRLCATAEYFMMFHSENTRSSDRKRSRANVKWEEVSPEGHFADRDGLESIERLIYI
jgi:hypothetical protein